MMVDMRNRLMTLNWKRCMRLWSQSMRLIKFSMLHRDKVELVFTWPKLEKRHPTSELPQHSKIKIWCSHNTESQVLSFGVVFPFSKWHISYVEIIKILEKENKCQFIMVQKIWIFVPSVLLYVLSSHKQLEQDINIESITKTKLLSHILEKEQPQRVISIQLWISLQLWGVRLYSIAEIICTPSPHLSMINMQVMVSL